MQFQIQSMIDSNNIIDDFDTSFEEKEDSSEDDVIY